MRKKIREQDEKRGRRFKGAPVEFSPRRWSARRSRTSLRRDLQVKPEIFFFFFSRSPWRSLTWAFAHTERSCREVRPPASRRINTHRVNSLQNMQHGLGAHKRSRLVESRTLTWAQEGKRYHMISSLGCVSMLCRPQFKTITQRKKVPYDVKFT